MRIEIWASKLDRFQSIGYARDWSEALLVMECPRVRRRKRIRIRTFYDRHIRDRVVQILAGSGWGVR